MDNIRAGENECRFEKEYFISLFGDNDKMPFSFEYDGKIYGGFDSDFEVKRRSGLITANHFSGSLTVMDCIFREYIRQRFCSIKEYSRRRSFIRR
jgi:hypothetical protein